MKRRYASSHPAPTSTVHMRHYNFLGIDITDRRHVMRLKDKLPIQAYGASNARPYAFPNFSLIRGNRFLIQLSAFEESALTGCGRQRSVQGECICTNEKTSWLIMLPEEPSVRTREHHIRTLGPGSHTVRPM